MKQIHFIIVAIPLSVVLNASWLTQSKNSGSESRRVDVWYQFVGNPSSSSDRGNPSKYIKFMPQPADTKLLCPGADVLCAVKLPDNATTKPTQTDLTSIQTEITNAQNTNTETSRVELCDP